METDPAAVPTLGADRYFPDLPESPGFEDVTGLALAA